MKSKTPFIHEVPGQNVDTE